jgi:hypothetical protein
MLTIPDTPFGIEAHSNTDLLHSGMADLKQNA